MTEKEEQRMLELLADQATCGLGEEEALELKRYLKQFPELEDDNSFELTAAAIGLAFSDISEPLPENLRKRISIDAEQFFDSKEKARKFSGSESKSEDTAGSFTPQNMGSKVVYETKRPFWQWLGWAFAGVACIALAINLWTTRFQKPTEIVQDPKTIQTPTPELSTAQKREQFLSSAADKIQTNWTEAKPSGNEISGDVVWSNTKQEGYLRFRGLPVNDPNKETYQLWIVDEEQDEKTPIDGGIFDVNEKGEIIVPINAKLKVKKPKLFALTIEKPGGVVVSKQGKVVAIAKV